MFVSFVAFFKPADDCHHITGQAVTEEEQEEDERRLPVDEQQYQHGQYHAHKRHLAADVDFFEAPKRNLHNHGNTGKQGNAQCPPMHAGEAFDAVVDPNQADNQRSGGRAWNADKPAFIDFSDERVKQRQTQGGAGVVDEAAAKAVLDQVGLAHRMNHRPSQLSGGEQQRVCIARALVNQPPVIFADEPTGNLDETNENLVLNLLTELNRQGRTIVMVTHNPDLGKLTNRIIYLQHGKLLREEKNAG